MAFVRNPRSKLLFYGMWWALLLLVSIAILRAPAIPVGVPSPAQALAVATLAAAVGFTILYLGVLRFSVRGRPADLFAGLGFGVLGFANLLLWFFTLDLGAAPTSYRDATDWLYLTVLMRGIAAALFVIATIRATRKVVQAGRQRFAIRTCAVVAVPVVFLAGLILSDQAYLPAGIGSAGHDLLTSRAIIDDILPDQRPWLLLVNAGITALSLVAALGFTVHACRFQNWHISSLALTLSLLAFGQGHAMIFPPADPDYVSPGDAFRLAGYVLFLCLLVARVGNDILEHVAGEERLRISRELHDGLAQHLGLLHIRLNKAAAPDRDPQRRQQDLEAALRIVEAALLEARQAVLSLRSGTVSPEQFRHTMSSFADEFGQNHDVAVEMNVTGRVGTVDGGLQAEVLRVLHEAFSNAVRHGEATSIRAKIVADTEILEIDVEDNGKGFAPMHGNGSGVGLDSMRERIGRRGGTLELLSAPGHGTRLYAHLPLRVGGGSDG